MFRGVRGHQLHRPLDMDVSTRQLPCIVVMRLRGLGKHCCRVEELSSGQDTLDQGVSSACHASTDKSGLAQSRAYSRQKITPRASRQQLIDSLSPPSHSTLSSLRNQAVIRLYTTSIRTSKSRKRDAGTYPLGRARPLFASIYGYATFDNWVALAPIKGTAATITICKNATNHAIPELFIHH